MHTHLNEYKDKLKKAITQYMQQPITERSVVAIDAMLKCLDRINKMDMKSNIEYTFDETMAYEWTDHMMNEDGTSKAHWSIDQTTALANDLDVQFTHISDYCWYVTVNMMYSDYYEVAEKFGINIPEFYGCLAKAFLFDKDAISPKAKISAYYHCIVKPAYEKGY